MKTIEKKVMQKIDNYEIVLSLIVTVTMFLSLLFLLITIFTYGWCVLPFLLFGFLLYRSIEELIDLGKVTSALKENKK